MERLSGKHKSGWVPRLKEIRSHVQLVSIVFDCHSTSHNWIVFSNGRTQCLIVRLVSVQ